MITLNKTDLVFGQAYDVPLDSYFYKNEVQLSIYPHIEGILPLKMLGRRIHLHLNASVVNYMIRSGVQSWEITATADNQIAVRAPLILDRSADLSQEFDKCDINDLQIQAAIDEVEANLDDEELITSTLREDPEALFLGLDQVLESVSPAVNGQATNYEGRSLSVVTNRTLFRTPNRVVTPGMGIITGLTGIVTGQCYMALSNGTLAPCETSNINRIAIGVSSTAIRALR